MRTIKKIGMTVILGVVLSQLHSMKVFVVEHMEPIHFTAVAEAKAEPREVLIERRIEWTSDRIEEEIRKVFHEDPETAIKVAKAESGLKPTAYNPEKHYDRNGNFICASSQGIMQVACVHNRQNPDALQDVEFNLQIARKVYDDAGWYPWGVCHDGKVDCGI